ncbi:hypothetical protein E0485_23615 [Paenibacillus albiflavus]|uniref:HTH-like domain-containing protein n=1 Tax=Paenibacillus albiflavus TaxID=2545760 RepID=A0A4R4E1M5_9BACL|nr:IS3 family transposase [Paenibacillus albiflavus]TCZ69671.1 hypothetical protein E0485_23615 [Paenibacillus albiflavus]
MEGLRQIHSITSLLSIAGIARASYYKWRATQPQSKARHDLDHELKEHMMAIHLAHPYFGYIRMVDALAEAGHLVNHKKVWRLMKDLKIQSVIRRKRRTSNYTPSVVYPNRLKRKFHATDPSKKWLRILLTFQMVRSSIICLLFKIYLTMKLSLGNYLKETTWNLCLILLNGGQEKET